MPMLHHERHQKRGGFWSRAVESMREIVFGLEDGLVSTVGVITGIAQGSHDSYIVVLSGFVVIFVEALSMAAGTYLSSKSEREVMEQMLEEEKSELETDPEKEKKELYEIYTNKGLAPEDAKKISESVFQNKAVALEEMKLHELGIGDYGSKHPLGDAVFMWFSYVIGGFVPLLAYFFVPLEKAIPVSLFFTMVGLFIVGAGKTVVTKKSWWRSGIEMTVVAFAAAGLGYLIGDAVSRFFGAAV